MIKIYVFNTECVNNKQIEEIIESFKKYEIISILKLRLTENIVIKVNKDIPFEEYLDIINHKEFINDYSIKDFEKFTSFNFKDITNNFISQAEQEECIDTFINQDGDIDSIENYKSNKKFEKKYTYEDYDFPF